MMTSQFNRIKMLVIAVLLPTVCLSYATDYRKLEVFAEWRDMEYKFPTKYQKIEALQDGRFVRGNSLPTDVDVYYEGQQDPKVFVAVPRFAPGVPVTLGYVTEKQGKYGPKLQPYPDYTWHSSNGTDCSRITSVIFMMIDRCARLWLLDSGNIGGEQVCQPQILTFDLKTDGLINRYLIPKSQYTSGKSYFVDITVDIRGSSKGDCKNTMVYATDAGAYGLIVYDYSCGESWRVENKLMRPDLRYETFTVSGESIVLKDGISAVALSPNCIPEKNRLLYFHSFAGATENTVPLRLLNNKENWISKPNSFPEAFVIIGSRRIQSAAEAFDKNGNLYFGLMTPNAIVCWDSSTPYKRSNFIVIALDDVTLQFSSGLEIITNSDGKEELWVITNRHQKFQTTMSSDEVNYRILTIALEKILVGKRCKGPSLE